MAYSEPDTRSKLIDDKIAKSCFVDNLLSCNNTKIAIFEEKPNQKSH